MIKLQKYRILSFIVLILIIGHGFSRKWMLEFYSDHFLQMLESFGYTALEMKGVLSELGFLAQEKQWDDSKFGYFVYYPIYFSLHLLFIYLLFRRNVKVRNWLMLSISTVIIALRLIVVVANRLDLDVLAAIAGKLFNNLLGLPFILLFVEGGKILYQDIIKLSEKNNNTLEVKKVPKVKKKRFLIAHQSSIPHYRVELFNQMQDRLPDGLEFEVADEKNISKRNRFFKEKIDFASFRFKVRNTSSYFIGKTKYHFQTFIFNLWHYDVIIVENALNNLSYPLSIFYKLVGKKVLMWGHGRDLNNPTDRSTLRKIMEAVKFWLVKCSDGFLAYTPSVEKYLMQKGISQNKITVLYNTIDIMDVRKVKDSVFETQRKLNKKIVFTGRLTKSKRIEFLLEAFMEIHKKDNDFELHVIGDGEVRYKDMVLALASSGVIFHGEITEQKELALIYKDMDFYIYPGYVGLGVLHAMCFDLVPVVIDSDYHKPEYDYLNDDNSIIFSRDTSAAAFADYIVDIYRENPELLLDKRIKAWDTIKQYTIQNMANQFLKAVSKV